MTELEQQVLGTMVCGFPGVDVPPLLQELLRRGLGGVILFQRNLPDLATALGLTDRLHQLAPEPLVVCVDQEGGRVQRLGSPLLQLPSMRALGSRHSPELCHRAGRQLGRELRALGFQLDLAPVLDVDSNPANPVIAERAFSSDPQTVVSLAIAFGLGLQEGGVAACGKHFPGHGDTHQDSHLTLPTLASNETRLRTVEWLPFAAAARAGFASMMMAHLKVACLDEAQPTSLSPVAYQRLRQELAFSGLILTDDLEMQAVAEQPGVVPATRLALAAGADGLLVCHRPELVEQALEEIVVALERNTDWRLRLGLSAERWKIFKSRWAPQRARPNEAEFRALCQSPERLLLEKTLAALVPALG